MEPIKLKTSESKKYLDDLQCKLLCDQITKNIDLNTFWDK